MKKILLAGSCGLLAVWLPAAYLDMAATEHKEYKVGEEVAFSATAYESAGKKLTAGKYIITVKDSGGKRTIKKINVDIAKNNPVKFTASLDRPGFIFAQSSALEKADGKSVKWSRKPFSPNAGAAVEPEKIKAGAERPADFNDFWQKGIQEFKKAKIEVTPAPDVKYRDHDVFREDYDVFRVLVNFPDGSGAIDGFLAVPKKPGKYPALVGVPGAGPGTITAGIAYAPDGPSLKLFMNVHLFRTARTWNEQKKLYAAYNKSFPEGIYTLSQAEDRSKYIYRNVWLAVNRSIDLLLEHKYFDGKNLAAVGSSQGGGTAIALGGMNPKITVVAANVPAFCDHHGWKAGRSCGWPQLHSKKKGKADNTAHYFDAANFALNIKVPAMFSAGYVDTTCSPSSVYAAYNNLQGPKQICQMPRTGHADTKEFQTGVVEFLNKNLTGK